MSDWSCRICGSREVVFAGTVEYLAGFPCEIIDCRECGCRTSINGDVYHEVPIFWLCTEIVVTLNPFSFFGQINLVRRMRIPCDFQFHIYASGEYSRILEQSWAE